MELALLFWEWSFFLLSNLEYGIACSAMGAHHGLVLWSTLDDEYDNSVLYVYT